MRKLILALILLFSSTAFAVTDTGYQPANWGINGDSTVNYGMSTLAVGGVWALALAANQQRAYLSIQPTCSKSINIALGRAGTATIGTQIGGGAVGTSTWNPPIPPINAIYLQYSDPTSSCLVQIMEGIH